MASKTVPGPNLTMLSERLPKDSSQTIDFYRWLKSTYGDYVRVHVTPGFTFYVLFDPKAVEHILQTHQKNYRKPNRFNDAFRLLGGNGILVNDGDSWIHQRRLMQPAFHRERLEQMSSDIASNVQTFLQEWDKLPDGSVVDLPQEMARLTLRIVGKALFSRDLSGESDEIVSNLVRAFEHVSHKLNAPMTLPEWLPTKGNFDFQAARKELDKIVWRLIEEHKSAKNQNDLLAMLINARDEETGKGMSEEQLRDEVITLLIAGHDTVGAALSWTFLLLAQNPDKRAILNNAVRAHLEGAPPTSTSVQEIPYCKYVLEEAMRLYPPAWGLPREARTDDVIEGFHIEKGHMIGLSQFMTHRDPRFWDEPESFVPERFEPAASASRSKFTYFPFGGGSRICIGMNFALLEATLAIAAISQRYNLDLASEHPVDIDFTFTLKPKPPLKFALRRA